MSRPAFPGHITRDDPDLSDRQRDVFAALVALHGRSARPVGSESLAQQAGIKLSSASIRAALSDLESMGFLERSHASGGRVPSTAGFAFYVRALLHPKALPAQIEDGLAERLAASAQNVEHLLNEASRLLSSMTLQLGLAVAASLDHERLSRLDLASLDEQRVLMVLDLGEGAVQTLVLELESPLEPSELEEVANELSERLVRLTLSEVRERLAADPELVRRAAVRMVAAAAAVSWRRRVSTPLFSAGAMHIAEQPEFASMGRIAPILRLIEDGSPLDRLMVAGVEGQVAARVGVDEEHALAACSLVSYPLPGRVRAAVGILGPLRMDYALAFAVVDAIGARVAELLPD